MHLNPINTCVWIFIWYLIPFKSCSFQEAAQPKKIKNVTEVHHIFSKQIFILFNQIIVFLYCKCVANPYSGSTWKNNLFYNCLCMIWFVWYNMWQISWRKIVEKLWIIIYGNCSVFYLHCVLDIWPSVLRCIKLLNLISLNE